jgi:hypothetical protein
MPSKVMLKLKGGAAVDPDSHLEDIAHVYKKKADIYNAVLGVTDIQNGKNSYYKLQVLEADAGNRYVCQYRYEHKIDNKLKEILYLFLPLQCKIFIVDVVCIFCTKVFTYR